MASQNQKSRNSKKPEVSTEGNVAPAPGTESANIQKEIEQMSEEETLHKLVADVIDLFNKATKQLKGSGESKNYIKALFDLYRFAINQNKLLELEAIHSQNQEFKNILQPERALLGVDTLPKDNQIFLSMINCVIMEVFNKKKKMAIDVERLSESSAKSGIDINSFISWHESRHG